MRPPTSKEAPFANDLSRDAFEKRLRIDFRSIFKTGAQEGTYEKHVKTNGFCRFFISRRFFERVGLLERNSVEKFPKMIIRTPLNRPKLLRKDDLGTLEATPSAAGGDRRKSSISFSLRNTTDPEPPPRPTTTAPPPSPLMPTAICNAANKTVAQRAARSANGSSGR